MATRLLLEIAGGAVTTAPLAEDLLADDIRPLVEKYLRGADPEQTWERLKVLKLIRDLAASEYSGYWNTEIIHGSGSPAAEILAMYRETDLGACKRLVERALSGREAIMPPAGAAA
jgi:4-hydroxybutyryl-CoA dehydratase/vinylacetyl-CoA-Delta-isomerase